MNALFPYPPCTCTSSLQRTSCMLIVLGREGRSDERESQDKMNDSALQKGEPVTPPTKEAVKRKYCAKCQNHQRMEVVKGHKRHCSFKWCRCVKCRCTDEKRKITARNVQMRREELLEREKAAARNMNVLDLNHGVGTVEERVESRAEENGVRGDFHHSSKAFPETDNSLRQVSTQKDEPKTNSAPSKKVKIWNEKGEEKSQSKVAWKSIIALCDDIKGLEIHHLLHLILKEFAPNVEEARYRIMQAMREVAQEFPVGQMWEEPVQPPLSHHYQWTPTYYPPLTESRAKELQESAMYKLPSALYPRPDPFAFPFPLLRAIPYGFTHTVPSTSYTIPTHEGPRPTGLGYDDYQKYENKGTSPFSLHQEEPPSSFSQVEI